MLPYTLTHPSLSDCRKCPNRFSCEKSKAPHGKIVEYRIDAFQDIIIYEDGYQDTIDIED